MWEALSMMRNLRRKFDQPSTAFDAAPTPSILAQVLAQSDARDRRPDIRTIFETRLGDYAGSYVIGADLQHSDYDALSSDLDLILKSYGFAPTRDEQTTDVRRSCYDSAYYDAEVVTTTSNTTGVPLFTLKMSISVRPMSISVIKAGLNAIQMLRKR